jgi:uncharacterized repeat protein (TIGR01451 family)
MKIHSVRLVASRCFKPTSITRLLILIALVALVVAPLFSSSSASSQRERLIGNAVASDSAPLSQQTNSLLNSFRDNVTSEGLFSFVMPQGPGESIVTYDSTCTNLKSSFNLGETVCAIVTGAPLGTVDRAARRIAWVSPYGSLTQGAEITTDPQTGYYLIPTAATQTFTDDGGGMVTVDNRGTWRIYLTSAGDGSVRSATSFTVHDPAKAFVDLSILQAVSTAESQVGAGSSSVFELYVNNIGPNAATNVVITDTMPANVTFTTATEETGGPGFVCGSPTAGVFTCTLASLPVDMTAHISFNFSVDGGTPAGTILTNTASISSSDTPCNPDTPCELRPEDNSSTATAAVPADTGSPTCTLDCPNNITVTANTSQNDVAGAFVTYSAAQPVGSCGAVSNSPASGSFFAVGSNTVTSSAESGDTCTFVVTVLPPNTPPPTITCPADKTVTAPANSSEATVAVGTPTTNPSTGVTITAVRSDEVSNCDPGPCPPKALTDPYPVGVTLITWKVTDSTAQTATCTQKITVNSSDCGNDTTPPTITAPPAVTAYTGPGSTTCGVALSPSDNELGSPVATDNCSVTVTSDIPPGNLFPVGTTTVHYTATDGSGNTATATQVVTVIDNTLPNISAPADASYTCPEQVPAGSPSQAHGTDPNLPNGGPVTDNCGTPTVTVADTSSGAGSVASPRIITRTFTATDSHGNSASAAQTITVTDGTPPTITAPVAVTAYTGAGATSCDTVISNATLGTASAQDNCAGVTVSRSPSGNTFAVGPTTVVWTATDWAGNTATANQTVTVIDNTVPVVTAPAAVTLYTGPGATSCGVTVSDLDATLGTGSATDNCPGVGAVTRSGVPAGNTFPKGVTTLTYSATDAHGNTGTATQTVTVVDNTPPTISCQADIIADFDAGAGGAVVTYTAPVGTDNCPGATTSQIAGLASGATFPLGTTTNTFRVTDAAGNTAQCSFKVTVALTSIVGVDTVSITGNALVDSYDSTIGYPASKGSLANVLSNGLITISGSSKVFGNVRSTRAGVTLTGTGQINGNATAGTTVSKAASAVITGTITNNALAPVMALPAVPACGPPYSSASGISGTYTYNASTGDLTLSGINIATLANGNYCFHNVSLSNSGQLKVNGPVVIKITGTLSTSGATSLPNTTLIPSNLQILSSYSGGNGVNLGNSSSLQLVIYAPNTNVSITGSAPLFGTVDGKTITLSNSGMIHYDTRLKTIWPGIWTLIFGP